MLAISKSTVAGFASHCTNNGGPLKKIVAEIMQDQEAKKRRETIRELRERVERH